jgi:hypothetical protein
MSRYRQSPVYRRCRYSPVVRRGFRCRETRSRGRSLLSEPDISAIDDRQVFSGDQLNGQKTSYDSRSVSAKFTKPVIDRQIPWCAVFGNHDSEIADDRAEQMRALQSLPYSLAQPGPKDIDGVGNCTSLVYPRTGLSSADHR